MAYEPLTPLPFLPIPGAFNLNTFIPGSSDYEIMARLVQTYNKAVELFNQIIAQYSDIDATITELTKEYQKQLDNYKADTDAHITSFENDINTAVNDQNSKITELAATVVQLQKDIDDLLNGAYIDNYVKALATWIDNNLQQLVAKVVKYVWFEVDESGYFVAYIPDTWDFVDFGTELDPDNEDYGKLVLDWEPLVPDDPAFQTIPEPPDPNLKTTYIPNQADATQPWDYDKGEYALLGVRPLQNLTAHSISVNTNIYKTDGTTPDSLDNVKFTIIFLDPDYHETAFEFPIASSNVNETFDIEYNMIGGLKYPVLIEVEDHLIGLHQITLNVETEDFIVNSIYYAGAITYTLDNTERHNFIALPNISTAFDRWSDDTADRITAYLNITTDIAIYAMTINMEVTSTPFKYKEIKIMNVKNSEIVYTQTITEDSQISAEDGQITFNTGNYNGTNILDKNNTYAISIRFLDANENAVDINAPKDLTETVENNDMRVLATGTNYNGAIVYEKL